VLREGGATATATVAVIEGGAGRCRGACHRWRPRRLQHTVVGDRALRPRGLLTERMCAWHSQRRGLV